jgi:hypothetical protein
LSIAAFRQFDCFPYELNFFTLEQGFGRERRSVFRARSSPAMTFLERPAAYA